MKKKHHIRVIHKGKLITILFPNKAAANDFMEIVNEGYFGNEFTNAELLGEEDEV